MFSFCGISDEFDLETWPISCEGFKGIVHPNMKMVIICSPTHVVPNLYYPIDFHYINKNLFSEYHQLCAITMYFFVLLLENNNLVSFATQWTIKLVQMTWTVHMDPTSYEMYITCARHNDSHKPETYFFLHF